MAAASVRRVMAAEIDKPENRGYADNGIAAFKEAAARLMQREFGVRLDPATEINHCIGTKTALAMLPAAFINPGDVTLMTTPGYPVAGTHTKYYGGEVYRLPLLAKNGFLPDLDAIPAEICRRAKLLVLNYPNSPTGRVATPEFYARVIEFARANQMVVVQDAAHVMLTYEGRPLSFLQVPGARDVGVEVHSLSKGWNMIGWRMGWVCGNERIVRALADVKDNCDSGQFIAIQKAAAAALDDAEIPAADAGEVSSAIEEARGRAAPLRLRLPTCPADRISSTRPVQRGCRRAAVRHGRGGRPLFHHRAFDLHGALGRRRGVFAALGDV